MPSTMLGRRHGVPPVAERPESVVMQIGERCGGWLQCRPSSLSCVETLCSLVLTRAARVVVVPTAGGAADAESSNGDEDGRLASAQAQVMVGDGVPWAAGDRTALSDQMHVWKYLLGEWGGDD
jgi:hypothetical protein